VLGVLVRYEVEGMAPAQRAGRGVEAEHVELVAACLRNQDHGVSDDGGLVESAKVAPPEDLGSPIRHGVDRLGRSFGHSVSVGVLLIASFLIPAAGAGGQRDGKGQRPEMYAHAMHAR
jgi:hypothetical protein